MDTPNVFMVGARRTLMMPRMLEHRVQLQFAECADLAYQAAEALMRPVAAAADAAVACLTAGNRLLVAGLGAGAPLGQWLCAALVGGLERERPPLAALSLMGAMRVQAVGGNTEDASVQQLRALGQPGDLLVLFAPENDAVATALVDEAHAKDMSVLLLSGPEVQGTAEALAESDVWIGVPHERLSRVLELQLLVLHALVDAIDVQLLGEFDTP